MGELPDAVSLLGVVLVTSGIVTAAMALGPMGSASTLRVGSVLFAAAIGRFFLGERLTVTGPPPPSLQARS